MARPVTLFTGQWADLPIGGGPIRGRKDFQVQSDGRWHIYSFDLGRDSAWTSGPVSSLWIQLASLNAGHLVEIDWIRLTPAQSRRITWQGDGLSGTASVDEKGDTVHPGDFRAQCMRTYRNLTRLLAAEGASWHDIVRTTCYLRDIERDYDTFNEMRTMFLSAIGVDQLPASTGIQARLCRSDLLIEIEAIAIVPRVEPG